MMWRLMVLEHVPGRRVGVWEPLGRPWHSYRDASLYRDEMRVCGVGTIFEVVEEVAS